MARATGRRGRRPAAADAAINRSATSRSNRRGSDTTAIFDAQTGRRVNRRRVQATVRQRGSMPGGLRLQSRRGSLVTQGRGELVGGNFG